MLHNHEGHLVKGQVLTESYRLDACLYLVLIGLSVCDHEVKGQNGVSESNFGKLLTFCAHFTGVDETPSPFLVSFVNIDLLG